MNNGLYLDDVNWINNINYDYPLKCKVQVRHQHTPVNSVLIKDVNGIKVSFDEQIRAIAPGQSAVFYNDNLCLGGGIIAKTF
jgi:tRNA-specific 2-thiouridylase